MKRSVVGLRRGSKLFVLSKSGAVRSLFTTLSPVILKALWMPLRGGLLHLAECSKRLQSYTRRSLTGFRAERGLAATKP